VQQNPINKDMNFPVEP